MQFSDTCIDFRHRNNAKTSPRYNRTAKETRFLLLWYYVGFENNNRLEELKRRLDYFDFWIGVKKVLKFIKGVVYIKKGVIFAYV